MIDFCRRNGLTIVNTMWKYQPKDKYTYIAEERNVKSLISYITYTQKLRDIF